jgi:hypothetical protein
MILACGVAEVDSSAKRLEAEGTVPALITSAEFACMLAAEFEDWQTDST